MTTAVNRPVRVGAGKRAGGGTGLLVAAIAGLIAGGVPRAGQAEGLTASLSRPAARGAGVSQVRGRTGSVARGLPVAGTSCRRPSLRVARGAVFLDGQRVHPGAGKVDIVVHPTWRRDRCAVAWVERAGPERAARLIVLRALDEGPASILPWQLPALDRKDWLFWADDTRVVVGRALLAPRAVASWTEETVGPS